jgi:hypothetical protein
VIAVQICNSVWLGGAFTVDVDFDVADFLLPVLRLLRLLGVLAGNSGFEL